jgi:hypothetical protein
MTSTEPQSKTSGPFKWNSVYISFHVSSIHTRLKPNNNTGIVAGLDSPTVSLYIQVVALAFFARVAYLFAQDRDNSKWKCVGIIYTTPETMETIGLLSALLLENILKARNMADV